MNSKEYNFTVKLDNKIVDNLLAVKKKRALFIYIYLLRNSKNRVVSHCNLSELTSFLNLPSTSRNVKTAKISIDTLISEGLVEVYTERFRNNKLTSIDIADIKGNTPLYIVAKESDSESFFTLIDADYIDKIFYQESEESPEDMMAILSLLCRQIERREEVLQVAWYSVTNLTSTLGISPNRYIDLITEMKKLEVIFYDKAVIKFKKGKKEHYIYSMFDDSSHVEQAVSIAESNGVLDARVKIQALNGDMDYVVEMLADEDTGQIEWLATTRQFQQLLDDVGYELNDSSAPLLNEFATKYSPEELIKTINIIAGDKIGGQYTNLISIDNVTGFYSSRFKKGITAKSA